MKMARKIVDLPFMGGDDTEAKFLACRARAMAEVQEAIEEERIAAITTLCDLAKKPDRAAAFIAKRTSVSDALAVLYAEFEAKLLWDKQVAQHNAQFDVRH